eukprot:TRINITY_DN2431_c0_g1_i21.p1 TRINITY_DN2431_c0_g1~~TRINITY_DN2431_c0_g1_i21.p1  ORF type:complete len:131 (-),score=6.67 TRINITY_DN2431_c0_g1_i21:184-576(-)
MECIEVISGGRSFWNPSSAKEGAANRNSRSANGEPVKKMQTLTIYDKFPHWFSANEGGTIYEWLCAFLEQMIVYKYISIAISRYHINNSKPHSAPEAFTEFNNLFSFWNNLTSHAKAKVNRFFTLAHRRV